MDPNYSTNKYLFQVFGCVYTVSIQHISNAGRSLWFTLIINLILNTPRAFIRFEDTFLLLISFGKWTPCPVSSLSSNVMLYCRDRIKLDCSSLQTRGNSFLPGLRIRNRGSGFEKCTPDLTI